MDIFDGIDDKGFEVEEPDLFQELESMKERVFTIEDAILRIATTDYDKVVLALNMNLGRLTDVHENVLINMKKLNEVANELKGIASMARAALVAVKESKQDHLKF